ncbi:hypothetical protein F7725_028789 [Dissostichus mawsoni]|uniref:Uncharacterized protein n=1 Tax=Dissostichus mawsoni TaxID=36200 RepID=A0A7J5XH27_DISMA|nr:hypothetical protein F7725_028789 [Dissostichus mawsoni]
MLGGDSDGAAAAPAAQPPQPPQLQANANAPPSATSLINQCTHQQNHSHHLIASHATDVESPLVMQMHSAQPER